MLRSGCWTYAGSIEVIVSPDFALTNLLLMKRPVLREIFLPFGAVRSTVDILRILIE